MGAAIAPLVQFPVVREDTGQERGRKKSAKECSHAFEVERSRPSGMPWSHATHKDLGAPKLVNRRVHRIMLDLDRDVG